MILCPRLPQPQAGVAPPIEPRNSTRPAAPLRRIRLDRGLWPTTCLLPIWLDDLGSWSPASLACVDYLCVDGSTDRKLKAACSRRQTGDERTRTSRTTELAEWGRAIEETDSGGRAWS